MLTLSQPILSSPQVTPGMFDEHYVSSSRVHTARSVHGLCLPPACWREAARLVVTARSGLEGDRAGRYYSLGEMSDKERQLLIAANDHVHMGQ